MTPTSDDDDVNPLLEELSRGEKKPQADRPAHQQAHTYRAPRASDRVGTFSAVLGVFGDLFKGGATRATPLLIKLAVFGVLLAALAAGGFWAWSKFGASSDLRKETMAALEPYRVPIRSATNQLIHVNKVNAYMDTVDFKLDPVLTEAPQVVQFQVYKELDKLNLQFGGGTYATGSVNLRTRNYTIRLLHEGSPVVSETYTLPEADAPTDPPAN